MKQHQAQAQAQAQPQARPTASASLAPTSASRAVDRTKFDHEWTVYALRVPPKYCQRVRAAFKPHLLSLSRVPVVAKPSSSSVLLLLSRYLVSNSTASENLQAAQGNLSQLPIADDPTPAHTLSRIFSQHASEAPADVRPFVESLTEASITTHPVRVSYDNCSIEHVLSTILPSSVTIPSSFETIGHIAHLNLRDEHLVHRFQIASVMLDKLAPRIRTIVNKTAMTGGPYRTFAMDVLAGCDNLETCVKENGCKFSMDFRTVYWNSRLETEHRRIVSCLQQGDVFVDPFCGIGPFAIPAAKQMRCDKVYANDLNPASVKYLRQNVRQNWIPDNAIETSEGCARDFIRDLAARRVRMSKVVMNFPSGAPEFLDVFRGLYSEMEQDIVLPEVHCYCFVKEDGQWDEARTRVRVALFGREDEHSKTILPDDELSVRLVRDVAPRKVQVCVRFKVPKEVMFEEKSSGRQVKRQKVSQEQEGCATG